MGNVYYDVDILCDDGRYGCWLCCCLVVVFVSDDDDWFEWVFCEIDDGEIDVDDVDFEESE